jgi:arylsulfatase A-like enzyme
MNSYRSYFQGRHLVSCLLATCLGFLACPALSAEKHLNIVLLLADDWRFDTLGVAGNPVVKTPHLDKLAAEGVRFTEACVTTPICGVSRSSILSGQWMSRHGNRAFQSMKTPWSQSYPGVLRANGYHVGHVGKWHSGKFPAKEFDFGRAYSGKHWIKRPDGNRVHVTQKNEEDALEFLSSRPKDKPFMLNLWFFAPHAEDENPKQFLPQPESMKLYQDVKIPIPPLANETALKNLPSFLQAPENEGRVRYHWRFDTPEKYQTMMKNYYRLCTEVDAVCGRVIDELKKQNLLDNTIIIFSSDNGFFHGDRQLADKWYPYAESIRVPMIVLDPRMPAGVRGKTRDEFVLNVDLAPTFLTAAGLSIPKKMQGRDFSPLYLNAETAPSPPWRDEFFCEHATISKKERIPSSEAVVRKDLKYTLWPEWNFEELYDLTKDPLEQKNLVHSPEYAGKLAELKKRLESMRKEAH